MLQLPYAIKKDRIGDASIKLAFNQDEAWTRACKYTLTCCKFVLACASNLAHQSSSGGRSSSSSSGGANSHVNSAAGGGGGGGGGA